MKMTYDKASIVPPSRYPSETLKTRRLRNAHGPFVSLERRALQGTEGPFSPTPGPIRHPQNLASAQCPWGHSSFREDGLCKAQKVHFRPP